jgi:hypothetical protein
MEKLNKLIQKCKCGVYITVNSHRDSYQTIEQYFESPIYQEYLEDIDKDVFEKMKQTDTFIELQFYPDTPVGFYNVFHYDLEKAIDEALSTFNF